MSLLIETEVEVKFDFDYEALASRVVESALDYEAFPYECEVNLTLTDNDGIWEINREYGVAQQGQLGQAFSCDDGSSLRIAGLFAFGENDVLDVGLGLRLDLIDDCHCESLRKIFRTGR